MPRSQPAASDARITDLLKRQSLSVTHSRKRILQLFVEQAGALSHGSIEKKLGSIFDRVTIYRTLQTFLDRGIIHSIPSADNTVRYALCKEDCGDGLHRHQHIHFVCKRCQQTFCLDESVTPSVRLPRGYVAQAVEILVQGQCKQCTALARL